MGNATDGKLGEPSFFAGRLPPPLSDLATLLSPYNYARKLWQTIITSTQTARSKVRVTHNNFKHWQPGESLRRRLHWKRMEDIKDWLDKTTTPNGLQAPLTISEEMRRPTAQVPTPSVPASVAISRNYLGKPLPKDPWGNEYYYEYPTDRRQNGKPAIWSAGPDRIPETKDDITNWK